MEFSKKFGWIKQLADFRDGFIVLATVVYVMGYLVWSFTAWKNNIGPLPVLDSQYFSAGIPVFVFFVISFIIIKLSIKLYFEVWPKWLNVQTDRKKTIIKRSIAITCTILGIIIIALMFILSPTKNSTIFIITIFYFLSISYLTLLINDSIIEDYVEKDILNNLEKSEIGNLKYIYYKIKNKLLKKYIKYNKYIILTVFPIAALIAGIYFYIMILFPIIPQEFGGAKNRYAIIDIVKEDISEESLKKIINLEANVREKVIQTKKISVFYSGNDFLLIGNYDNKEKISEIFEISKSSIKVINWCN